MKALRSCLAILVGLILVASFATGAKFAAAPGHYHTEALIRDSWLWSCAQSFAATLQAAWLDSTARVVVRWTASQWR